MVLKNQKCHILKIGITGGIGSGKTTVCQIFETLGIPIYYADERAKQLMTESGEVRRRITETFGKDAYSDEGELNRSHLASIVFQNEEKLKALNGIVHPAVFEDAEQWHAAQSDAPYTIREAALLVENGSYRHLDKLIVVTAPEELRVRRVMERDGMDEKSVRARMAKQLPQSAKVAKADFIIANDGAHLLTPQVVDVHRSLVNK